MAEDAPSKRPEAAALAVALDALATKLQGLTEQPSPVDETAFAEEAAALRDALAQFDGLDEPHSD